MPTGQRLDVLFVKINRNPAFFQEAEGGILDMVAVQMRNDRAVNFGKIVHSRLFGLPAWRKTRHQ